MAQKMAITSPTHVFYPLESGWVVYGPENGYNFSYIRLLTPGVGWVVYGPENGYNFPDPRLLIFGVRVGRLWSKKWL